MIVAVIVVLAIVGYFVMAKRKSVDSIPMVKGGLPFFGHVFIMMKGSPWDTMAEWAQKYGTLCRFHLFGSEAVCIADPQALKTVLQTKLSSFKKDTDWTYKPFMVLLGNGIVTSEGQSWHRQRRLLASYLKFDILNVIPSITIKAVHRLIKKLDKAREDKQVVEMAEEFRHLTLQVIGEALLSLSPEECDQTFAVMYLPIVQEGNLRTWDPTRMYLPTPAFFQHQKDVKRLNDYVTSLITKRWEHNQHLKTLGKEKDNNDVLDKILGSITDEEWGTTVIEQVRDEIKTFVLAGHETSASMLAWALYEMSIDSGKNIIHQAVDEARSVYGQDMDKSGLAIRLPGKEKLDQLIHTECCLREALRKYSNVPTVVRVAIEDVQIGEHLLPKGSTVMVSMQGVHHNPEFWPEPLKFDPSRFLVELAPFTYLPFIDGPRSCLGQYLALLESKIVLSMLVSRFRFEVLDPVEAGRKHPFMVPIIPNTGHNVRVYDR